MDNSRNKAIQAKKGGKNTKSGHSSERIKQIRAEAASSSNPAYVLKYWGLK